MSNSTRQSNSGYDERYVMPLEASRRGAHRARVSPVMAVLPIVAVVGIVIGAIALVYLFFGGLGGSGSASQATSSVQGTPAVTTSAAPASTSTSAATPSASASTGGTVDKTISVSVYNATGVTGLARRYGAKVTAAGWSLGTVASWSTRLSDTVVYYGTDTQEATAQALVKVVGHGETRLSPAKAGTGISVVIGNDAAAGMGEAPITGTSTFGQGTTTHHEATRAATPSPTTSASPSPTS